MKEILMPVISVLAIIFGLAFIIDKSSCLMSYSEYQPQYGFFSGCRIVVDDKLTPVQMVRELNINN